MKGHNLGAQEQNGKVRRVETVHVQVRTESQTGWER